LSEKNNICQSVIYSQDNHGREHALQDSTQNIEYITSQPDNKKKKR
jgi:hypothetical protein